MIKADYPTIHHNLDLDFNSLFLFQSELEPEPIQDSSDITDYTTYDPEVTPYHLVRPNLNYYNLIFNSNQ